jgi:hypothetical protein
MLHIGHGEKSSWPILLWRKYMLNKRQILLQGLIDAGLQPEIVDASFIHSANFNEIPFHWGDLEVLGYGITARQYNSMYDKTLLSRKYIGPNSIKLLPQHFVMKTGVSIDD